MSDYETRNDYCPYCDDTTVIKVTVPWQQNICTECGNAMSADTES